MNLLDTGHHVILAYPAPSHNMELVKQVILNTPADSSITEIEKYLRQNRVKIPLEKHLTETELSYQLYDSLGRHPRLHRVYLDRLLCDLDYCYANDERNIYLNDPNHVSFYGAELIANEIEKVLFEIKKSL
ncbi:MAG: hypothetical protein ACJAVI_003785 [Candidatus Azotimanducaceae bacterium]|jgi:hypothetical protein